MNHHLFLTLLAVAGLAGLALALAASYSKDISTPGDYQGSGGRTYRNETGATIAFGAAAVVDYAQAEAENNTLLLGQEGLTAVTTALFKVGKMVFCRETAGVADHGYGRFADEPGDIVDVLVNSTTDIAKGDPLKGVNGQAYLVKATAGTDRPVAIALEARTSDDSGTIKAQIFPYGFTAIA